MKNILILCTILFLGILILAYYHITARGIYTNASNLTTPRAYHSSILTSDGNVFIAGGVNTQSSSNYELNSSEIFDVENNSFKKLANSNLTHVYHKTFLMSDGNIVIADINGIEIFNPKTNSYKLLTSKFLDRHPEFGNYDFVLLPNDLLAIFGGRKFNKTTKKLEDINSFEIINLKNDTVVKKSSFNSNGISLILVNDKLFLIGGKTIDKNNEILSSEINVMDTKTFKISKWGNLALPQIKPFVFVDKKSNNLVVLGGKIQNGSSIINETNYAKLKGANTLEIINLDTKESKTKNIQPILTTEKVIDNIILDCTQYSDNLYWLQLKSTNKNNSILLNIDTLTKEKLFYRFEPTIRYRSSNIKTKNGIFVSGGKLSYEEPTEYTIYSEIIPDATEAFQYSKNGFITNKNFIIKIKN